MSAIKHGDADRRLIDDKTEVLIRNFFHFERTVLGPAGCRLYFHERVASEQAIAAVHADCSGAQFDAAR